MSALNLVEKSSQSESCLVSGVLVVCQRFSILVAVMLSSQTKDEHTAACMQRLRDADVLSPEKMSRLSISKSLLRHTRSSSTLSVRPPVLRGGRVEVSPGSRQRFSLR